MAAPVFIVREYGDMCNVLWTFANAAALAAEQPRPLYNLVFAKYADFFAGTAQVAVARYPAAPAALSTLLWRSFGPEVVRRFLFSAKWRRRCRTLLTAVEAPDELEVRADYPPLQAFAEDRRALVLNAWNLHLPDSVERQAKSLRAFFSLAPAWKAQLAQWQAQALPHAGPLVGVHLRRGTPNYLPGDQFYHSDAYYLARMREMAAHLGPETSFLLCSDVEINREAFSSLRIIRGPGHRILDLYALADCQWILGPPSTYSAWASWFGEVPRAVVLSDAPLRLENFQVHRFA